MAIYEVRASQLAQASERVGSLIPASQQGRNVSKVFNPVVKLVLENQPFLSGYIVCIHKQLVHKQLGRSAEECQLWD